MTEIKVIQNDKLYDLNFTLQDSGGMAIDLTGSTIKLKVQQIGSSALKFEGTMSIVSGTEGKCKYAVAATDFDKVGRHYAEIEVTFTSNQILTFPDIVIIVEPELPK